MTALADKAPRPTKVIKRVRFPLAANIKAIQGGLAMGKDGYCKPAATATGYRALGPFTETKDNTGGSAGDVSAEVDLGRNVDLVGFFNDTATPVDATDVFQVVYMLDDDTVTADSSGASAAGVCWQVNNNSDGLVWVELNRS